MNEEDCVYLRWLPIRVQNIHGDPVPDDVVLPHVEGEASGRYFVCPLTTTELCTKGYSSPPRRECFRCGYEHGHRTALLDMVEDDEPEDSRMEDSDP